MLCTLDGKQDAGPTSGGAKGNIDLDKGKEGVTIGHGYGFALVGGLA